MTKLLHYVFDPFFRDPEQFLEVSLRKYHPYYPRYIPYHHLIF